MFRDRIVFFFIVLLLTVSLAQSNLTHEIISADIENNQILSDQTGEGPIKVKYEVIHLLTGVQFLYNMTNTGGSLISSFYLQNDAISGVDPATIIIPEGWDYKTVIGSARDGTTWQYMVWYWDSSMPFSLLLNPGNSTLFGFTFNGPMTAYQVNFGLWSVNDETASEINYDNPEFGQITNSTNHRSDLSSLVGLSVPTILFDPAYCPTGFLDTPLEINILNATAPIELEARGNNYTMKVDTNGTTQHNSTYGNNGCAPTTFAWLLQWWADHGVSPGTGQNQTDRDNATAIVDLIETLGKYMNTSSVTGTSINATITGLKKFLNDTNVPLNFTYYSPNRNVPQYDGNASIGNMFDEFLKNREAIAVYISGGGIGHAMLLTGVNNTDDGTACGFRITVMDPWDGTEKTLCMDTPDGKKGSQGYIFYNGAWRKIIGFMAVSPTNTSAVVTVENENKLIFSSVKINQLGNLQFTYNVRPTPGSGTLIDTFALRTNVSDLITFTDFVYPSDWHVTLKLVNGKAILFFHNNLYLGMNVDHLNDTGYNFSFLYHNTGITPDGMWYVGHSGLPTIDNYVEASGTIAVPSDTTPMSNTTTSQQTTSTTPSATVSVSTSNGGTSLTPTTSSTTPSNTGTTPTSSSNPLPMSMIFAVVLLPVIWKRRKNI